MEGGAHVVGTGHRVAGPAVLVCRIHPAVLLQHWPRLPDLVFGLWLESHSGESRRGDESHSRGSDCNFSREVPGGMQAREELSVSAQTLILRRASHTAGSLGWAWELSHSM